MGWGFAWLAALFALHAGSEWLYTRSVHPGWYKRLRMALSLGVIVLLSASAILAARGG